MIKYNLMETSQIYILISIVVLLIITIVVFFVRKDKKGKRLTTLASLSFVFVLAGIIFADSRLMGYSLIGAGILLAVIDIFLKSKNNRRQKLSKSR